MAVTSADWSDADVALLADVYDLECKSRMNVLYYGQRLGRLQAISFWMELVIAATASGSGLAALAIVHTAPGQWLWQSLALTAAVVAIIRPIYAPGKKIETFTRQLHGYHANSFALMKLAASIRQQAAVTDEHRRRYDTCFDRHAQLSIEDEIAPSRKGLMRARKLIDEELPPERFWWPERVPPNAGPQSQNRPLQPVEETAAAKSHDGSGPEAAASDSSVLELPPRPSAISLVGRIASAPNSGQPKTTEAPSTD